MNKDADWGSNSREQPFEIVRAIGNLLASGLPIANEIYALNHWR